MYYWACLLGYPESGKVDARWDECCSIQVSSSSRPAIAVWDMHLSSWNPSLSFFGFPFLTFPLFHSFSHGDHAGHGAVLERVRQAAQNVGRNVAILLDTKGPEIRSGFFANDAKKIDLVKGEMLILTTDYNFRGDNKKLACSYPELPKSVTPGQSILVADGSLVLTVLSCDEAAGEVQCRIENNTSIGERKNMNLPGVKVELPTFTEKDIDDIIK